MKKIDIHCHTTRAQLRNIIPINATIETIESEMIKHHIEKTVLLATYFPKDGKGISNYRLLHWIRNNSKFCLFGSLDFQNYFYSGLKELSELAEENFLYGIKVYSGYQKIDYSSQQFHQLAKLAEHYQLPLMFHGGYLQCHETDLSCAINPKLLENIVKSFPSNKFIISHLAWPFIDDLISMILRYDNILTDMSGMLDSYKTKHTFGACVEGLKKFLGNCGPSKLMFGTDFPIQTHADSIQLVESAMNDYSEIDKKRVYYDNANALLYKKKEVKNRDLLQQNF